MVLHGFLHQVHSGKAGSQVFRSKKHDECSTAADHNGIDKYSQCLHKTCFYRTAALYCGCCARSGAGAGFIGKKPSFHSIHKHCPKASGCHLPDPESLLKNPGKYTWKASQIHQYDHNGNGKITYGHKRNHHIQNLYCGIFAKHDHCRKHYQKNSCYDRRYRKSIFKRRYHGIADYLADPAPADQA